MCENLLIDCAFLMAVSLCLFGRTNHGVTALRYSVTVNFIAMNMYFRISIFNSYIIYIIYYIYNIKLYGYNFS